MNELQETLNILLHYDNIISGRTNFCKRNIDFNINDFVQNKLSKIENYNPNIYIQNDPILAEISRECADLKVLFIHIYA